MKTTVLLFLLYFSNSNYSQAPCNIPDPLFAEDTLVVCNDTITTISITPVMGASYIWSTGEGGVPSISITRDGRYSVTVTTAVCTRTDSIVVLFNSFNLAPLTLDLKLCLGTTPPALSATGQQLLWYPTAVGGTGSPTPFPASTDSLGIDSFWVSQTIRGCETPRSLLQVAIITKPGFELEGDFIIPCGVAGIVLQVEHEEETDYLWSNGSRETSILADRRGTYNLYARNMCGEHRDTVRAIQCEDRCVQFPSAFTPNGDGKNDLFRAFNSCPVSWFKLVIYNQTGVRVFEAKDPASGWNGSFNGKQQPVGVFVYYAEYFDYVSKRYQTSKGTILLAR